MKAEQNVIAMQKEITISSATLLGLPAIFSAQSQDDKFASFRFNPERSSSRMNLEDSENEIGKCWSGENIVERLHITDHFALQGAAVCTGQGPAVEYDYVTFEDEAEIWLRYIDVPLFLNYDLNKIEQSNKFNNTPRTFSGANDSMKSYS